MTDKVVFSSLINNKQILLLKVYYSVKQKANILHLYTVVAILLQAQKDAD